MEDGGRDIFVSFPYFYVREKYGFVREMSGKSQGISFYQQCGNPANSPVVIKLCGYVVGGHEMTPIHFGICTSKVKGHSDL